MHMSIKGVVGAYSLLTIDMALRTPYASRVRIGFRNPLTLTSRRGMSWTWAPALDMAVQGTGYNFFPYKASPLFVHIQGAIESNHDAHPQTTTHLNHI